MFLKRALALIIVALALPYACAPIYRFPPARSFAGARLFNPYARLHGRWQLANLHAHGRAWHGLTSGRQSDADVVKAYRARGYDVAGISDYFQIAAHDGVPTMALYEHGLNIGKHHQLVIGARRVEWFDLPLWQGVSQKQYVVDRVRASAELIAIAHPSIMPGGYTAADLSQLTGYDLFELVNGRFTAEDLWDAALSSGRLAWAIGDDDTHDVTDPDRMAIAWSMIDAPSASSGDIVSALRDGRTYAVSRTSSDAPDRTDARLSGVAVAGNVVTITCTEPAEITFVGRNGRHLQSASRVTTASRTFEASDSYLRGVIRTPHTVMYLNPVLRYNGELRGPVATVDEPRTWAMRAALIFACAALLLNAWRRRPGGQRPLRASERWSLRRASSFVLAFALCALISAPARAQTAAPPDRTSVGEGPPLGSTLTFDLLRDLPAGDNLFSVLENTQAEIISDRFSGGGINYGTAARVGAFGSSWTQTIYRIGDVNVTDGATSGAPMFFPEVDWWEHVSLASGLMPADVSAPGAVITLEPRRPTAGWTGDAAASTSFGDTLTAHGGSLAGPISTPTGWNRASIVASGPLKANRVGLFFAGSWTGASQRERGNATTFDSSVGSAFAHLLFTPDDRDEIKLVGILQRDTRPEASRQLFAVSAPSRRDISGHVQATWARTSDHDSGWRAFASFTQRSSTSTDPRLIDPVVDRVLAGPVPELVGIGDRTDRRVAAGGRLAVRPGGGPHTLHLGADATGIGSSIAPGFDGLIGETVDGAPARLWDYFAGTSGPRRATATVAAYAEDRIELSPRLTVSGALRYEWLGGMAEGSASRVRWNTLLPRADVQWLAAERFGVRLFGGYARTAYTLPIDALAWGDPNAPVAAVMRWTGPSAGRNPFVPAGPQALWGPGSPAKIGNPLNSSGIDPNLRRPYSDTMSIGIESHPAKAIRVQLAGVGKWERQLLGVVNASAAAPAYTTIGISDPGLDLASPADDQVLPVSNLIATPAHQYQFLLTNPAAATARLLALKFSTEVRTDKLFVLLGATAGKAEGIGGYTGFGPLENDQGVIGDAFVNPNAALFPRGRLFNDRAYTIKLTTIYRFPWGVRLGAIARYQDGQPFARLVVAPSLNQGAEAVRAFINGGSRFTYTGTLDVRLQKEFPARSHRVAIVLDGYNIVNLGNEVEERVITGTGFRTPTAIQPPLAVHVGARVSF